MSKAPLEKAVETEKELAEMEAEANAEAQQDLDTSEGEKQTPESDSATDKETSAQEEKETQSDEDSSQPQRDDVPDLTEEEVQQLSKKAQRRYRKLSGEVNNLSELTQSQQKEIEDLRKQLESKAKAPVGDDDDFDIDDLDIVDPKDQKTESDPSKLPWDSDDSSLDSDGESKEMTQEELEKLIENKSADQAKKIIKQQQERKLRKALHKRFTYDVETLQQEHPEFDPNSDSYNDDLVQELAADYRLQFEKDPRTRFYSFIKARMDRRNKLIEEGRKQAEEETGKKLARQAGEQPITSNASGSGRRTNVEDKINSATSIEELEALEKTIGTA